MIRSAIAVFAAVLATASVATAQDTRKFIPVAGDVFLFQNNFHLSLIVATEDGTVRVDPINADATDWLNANLSEITDQPVTHLIYSHSHLDHASGGSGHDGAITIAHENAPAEIDGVMPEVRVGASEALEIGGKTFELTHLGPGHGTDMLAVVVRPENVAFIVDVAAPKRMFFRNFNGANLDDWQKQIEVAQTLDFEIFAPGHGVVGTKADLDDVHGYMLALRGAVADALDAGKTVEQVKAEVTMDAYSDWIAYDQWGAMNVEGMAMFLSSR